MEELNKSQGKVVKKRKSERIECHYLLPNKSIKGNNQIKIYVCNFLHEWRGSTPDWELLDTELIFNSKDPRIWTKRSRDIVFLKSLWPRNIFLDQ